MQPDQTMNPAETLAALKLLEVALKGAIAAAEPAAEDYHKATRAKQLETDYGLLYVTRYKPSIVVDDRALLLWAEDQDPDLITTTRAISAATKRAILTSRWEIDDAGDIYDTRTGELITFAQVRPARESLTTRLTEEAKQLATAALVGGAPQLADGFAHLLREFEARQITKENTHAQPE